MKPWGFIMETVDGSVDLITRGLGESWTKTGQDRGNAPAGRGYIQPGWCFRRQTISIKHVRHTNWNIF